MATDITDLKQVKISKITLGLILSVVITTSVVVWNAAMLAGRIGDLEEQVQIVEANTGTDSSVLAKLDEISEGVLENALAIDAVRAARLDDLDRFAPSLIVEAIASDMNQVVKDVDGMKEIVAGLSWIPQEFNMVWDRLDELESE